MNQYDLALRIFTEIVSLVIPVEEDQSQAIRSRGVLSRDPRGCDRSRATGPIQRLGWETKGQNI